MVAREKTIAKTQLIAKKRNFHERFHKKMMK